MSGIKFWLKTYYDQIKIDGNIYDSNNFILTASRVWKKKIVE